MTPEQFAAEVDRALSANLADGILKKFGQINVEFTVVCEKNGINPLACGEALCRLYDGLAADIQHKTRRMVIGIMAGETEEEIVKACVDDDQRDEVLADLARRKAARAEAAKTGSDEEE